MEYFNEFHKQWIGPHSSVNSLLEQVACIAKRSKKQQERLNEQGAIREEK